MKIEVERITSWNRVLNAARFTVRKDPLDKEPSKKFKRQILFAEHSPIRLLEFDVRLYDVPKYITVHLCRHHEGVEKFVCTSRPDRNGFKTSRHEQHDDDLVNMLMVINAQAFINISKVRLCNHAEKETQKVWKAIVDKMGEIEPILAACCVPSCVYRGVCPEMHSCGFTKGEGFRALRNAYTDCFND